MIKKILQLKIKNKGIIFGTFAIGLALFIGVGVMKLNSHNSLAYDKKRDDMLEGITITDIALNYSNDLKKGPSKSYGKTVYITIDDGPSEYTDQIIDILNDNGVKATFFMINGRMKEYPQQVKNIVESGNVAGFHSVSHDVNKLYLTDESAKKEFDTNQETFKSITGKTSRIIRLPYGSKPYTPTASYNALVDAGYKLWDWNLDTEDWKSTTEQILQSVKAYSQNKDNVVLLMHERSQSVAALDEMIKVLKEDGFEFLAISENDIERNFWLENLAGNDN